MLFSFMFVICRNLREKKERDTLDLISFDNIELLNEQICEELSFFDKEDLNWETIEASLFILTLNDEKIHFNSQECLVELAWINFF